MKMRKVSVAIADKPVDMEVIRKLILDLIKECETCGRKGRS